MNFKKLAMGLALSAAFGFVACGDDDESSPVGPSNDPAVSSSSVKTSGDTDKSSDSKSSVKSSDSKTTAKSSDSKSSTKSSDSKSSAKSSGSVNGYDVGDFGKACTKEGDKKDGQTLGVDVKLICENGAWAIDSTAMMEIFKCSKEGATKDTTIMGMNMTMVCKDGQWATDYSCSKEGDTKTESLMGYEMKYVCTEGEWVMDASAFGGNAGGVTLD